MMQPEHDSQKSSVLVVEDDPAMLVAFRDILLDAGYEVCTASNGADALKVVEEKHPALILSDISMPVMDGFELCEAVRRLPGGIATPFIFITARGTTQDRITGKAIGADDYIAKPVGKQELVSAVQARLKRADELMVAQLKAAYKDSLLTLANAIEARDHYTREHVDRVNAYAQAMACKLGWQGARLEAVEFGAILHDIGKIAVREEILRKSGPLSNPEWDEVRRHPGIGARMIEHIPYLAPAVPMVMYHHERWDGNGYPDGLSGHDIPEEARLLAVADAFDAMTSDRPYRAAIQIEMALDGLNEETGRQFDPAMVDAFLRCWQSGELQSIAGMYQEDGSPMRALE